jgi:very-short-patch-repair endonuclease
VNSASTPLKHQVVRRARSLRREATGAENKLWQVLRNRHVEGAKFRRQVPVDHYFADFCCHDRKLIVEVDGSQHEEQERYDAARTAHLKAKGYRVLRFSNGEVLSGIEEVVEVIRAHLRGGR